MAKKAVTFWIAILLLGATVFSLVLVFTGNSLEEDDLVGVWLGEPAESRENSAIVLEIRRDGEFHVKWDSDLVGGPYHYEMLEGWKIRGKHLELNYVMVFSSGNRFIKRQVFRYSQAEGDPVLVLFSDQDGELADSVRGLLRLRRLEEE